MSKLAKTSLPIALAIFFTLILASCSASVETTAPVEETVEPAAEAEDPVVLVTTKINLNEASGDDFRTIPDVGNRMVREFEEYRPYISILQFRQEIGKYVNEEQVAAYEEYVYVPIDINESDAETLKQIPGVDDVIAADLIAARPFESNDVFLALLATFVSDEDLAVGVGYLIVP